jgi:hypothetical protein
MRFAILGDHPVGWSAARALIASGRHMVLAYQGPTPEETLRPDWPVLRVTTDIEEILADPQIEAVIVAGRAGERLDQLRRVLQSERPALCVHPVDRKPDGAYEMNLLQGDVHQVVVPLLIEGLHPQVVGLRRQLKVHPRLIDLTVTGPEDLLIEFDQLESPAYPGWAVLRRLGGEIVEVVGFAATEEVTVGQTVLVQGRFETGALLNVRYLPQTRSGTSRIEVVIHTDDVEPICVVLTDLYDNDTAWQSLIANFDDAIERLKATPRAVPGAGPALPQPGPLSWQDEIRSLELDDSTRRSIERRRAYTLEFQEATEDVGFKGTMTLVGCGLLWLIPVLLLVYAWIPQIGWLIVPLLVGFLGLQLLRWLVASPPGSS